MFDMRASGQEVRNRAAIVSQGSAVGVNSPRLVIVGRLPRGVGPHCSSRS